MYLFGVGLRYEAAVMRAKVTELTNQINNLIKTLQIKRYKFSTILHIVDKKSSIIIGSRCLADVECDLQTSYTFNAPTFSAICCIYAFYYE